jgi:DNA polymerase-4
VSGFKLPPDVYASQAFGKLALGLVMVSTHLRSVTTTSTVLLEIGAGNGLAFEQAMRVIAHLDLDACFASIEQRDNPELRGKPVIVGAPPTQRGVVAACSYEARKFGVRSAMPSVTAGRLCPDAVFVRPRMDVYREESRLVMGLVAQAGGVVEQTSIDEAYIDFSGVCPADEPDAALAKGLPLSRLLKQRIRSERQLTATVGIGSNKLLAKIGSDQAKPDGLMVILEKDKIQFLRPLPIRALFGVGKVTEQVLQRAGIQLVGDLQDFKGDLRPLVGSFASKLRQFAFGEDDRPLSTEEEVKSISAEETFLRDTEDRKVLRNCLRTMAADLAERLKDHRLAAHTVQIKVRYGDFTTLTRQVSVEDPLTEPGEFYRLGCFLLGREKLVCRPLRLIGLGVSNLREPTVRQLVLL